MSSEGVLLKIDIHCCKSWLGNVDVGNDQLRGPNFSFYGTFFRWGSYSDSAVNDCLEVTDLWMRINSPPPGHEDGPYELLCNSGCRGSWCDL